MEIIQMDIEDLKTYENNPRNNDEAVDKVANSIAEFGFKVPIIVDKHNVIIAGHTRLRASKKLGLQTVPVIQANELSEEQVMAFRLADNKTSEFAEWDMDKLDLELQALRDFDFDMESMGFSEDDFADMDYDMEIKTPGSLTRRFIVPPFTVLDTRQGYWLDRKKRLAFNTW